MSEEPVQDEGKGGVFSFLGAVSQNVASIRDNVMKNNYQLVSGPPDLVPPQQQEASKKKTTSPQKAKMPDSPSLAQESSPSKHETQEEGLMLSSSEDTLSPEKPSLKPSSGIVPKGSKSQVDLPENTLLESPADQQLVKSLVEHAGKAPTEKQTRIDHPEQRLETLVSPVENQLAN